jgi:hypothetical protein
MRAGLVAFVILTFVSIFEVDTARAQDLNLGAIYVCNEIVLRIRFPADSQSILQRRQIVNERIIEAYRQQQITPSNIQVRPAGGEWAIFVGSQLIITADREHARMNGTTPRLLAETWAAKLRVLMPKCRPDLGPRP